mgnify:CR=1 FL=1
MDHCQESGCNHDIIPDLTDGNDFGAVFILQKEYREDQNELYSREK